MRQVMLAGLVLLALMAPGAAWSGETVTGRAVILDGNTLNLRGKVIGLHGIAAPDPKQVCLDAAGQAYACGAIAARALAALIGDAIVACEPQQTDRDGRTTATCRSGNEDLGAWMAAQGYATAHRDVSGAYVADERLAWAKRRGLWSGAFDDPARRRRAPSPATNQIAAAEPVQRPHASATVASRKP
ncbi:thermonuclease family protein [Methylobacterium planeticum]|uniref:Thermonuclease family protein n=1 Tax=Methylobacterium planeticum TaxID=2615211 RepID=A0A6N6MV77_9HYPH|nr:thermonuclease family protein [Methylobacterium planeticum]KAB1075474.1 thermonuclease family protein [Methylobacterium planeticum]